MEDDPESFDGIRAHFPLSFGKKTKSQISTESIHNATRRPSTTTVVDDSPSSSSLPTDNKNNDTVFPSLSTSSKSWLNSLQKPPKKLSTVSDDDVAIGPPRPPPSSDSVDGEDDVMVGPPRPMPADDDDDEEEDEEPIIGPPRPPVGSDSDNELSEDEEENQHRIPLSNEIVLKGHTKVVSALAIDHSGSRVLSGSYDYSIRMYDFQGMNARLESFRQLEPSEGHQVRSLSWSPSSDRFLCVTGSAQAKNTKGHITGLTCGEWHPKTKETILTSSEDGSLRIWDVIKPKLARPGRVPVTTCAWDREGKSIAGGIGDGYGVLSLDGEVGQTFMLPMVTRMKSQVWDLRQMKTALKSFEDLPNHYAQTNVAFSSDEQLLLTGTSVERDSTTGGLLCLFDRVKLELVSKVGISPTCSVVQCAWHPKLNQILATAGDKHQGGTHVLYDPTLSTRGALVCVARAPRKKSIDDFQAEPVIHNPHALPLFRDQPSRKRQREKMLKDPLKSHKPEAPMNGPGFGGRVGVTKGSLLTQSFDRSRVNTFYTKLEEI
ncbi:WD40 repeat-containing protein [Cynara cardunculus var. scolymus]|uniref:WD40 repeat-containing protein n=1 Tax=Cynara cardunculus var. scolymus TaxID=59895 RepID=A0A124SFN7_CYNCS|nr:WD40 repeat-containing protein [Cynara cardunculus var. scolymus]